VEEWFAPGKLGIVFSVSRREDGSFRIVAGDVARDGDDGWVDEVPITFKDLTANEILETEVSERLLSDIGLPIVTRLSSRFSRS
jgi:hypothetical protein